MPTFEFTSPEGKKYRIQGPDSATKEQAFGILQQQLGTAPAAPNSAGDQVPGGGQAGNRNVGKPEVNDDSILQRIAGVGETALAAGTGAVGSVVGALAGAGKTLLGGKYGTQQGINEGEELAGRVANAMTYQPRTQTGANLAQLVGEAAERSGIAGLALPELNAAANAAGNATRAVRGAAAASAAVQDAADAAAVATKGPSLRDLVRAPSQLSGVGAPEASQAAQRAARAQALPAPIKLTRGQLTRDRTQVAFERETAKQKEGAPLTAHYEDQNATYAQNLDAYADETGAQAYGARAVGKSVVSALEAKDAAKQAEIRDLYQKARENGEMQGQVDVSGLVDWIAKNKGKDKLAPIISTIESELKQNAKVEGGGLDNLTLTPRPTRTVMTLDASEDLRQAINKLAEPGTPNVVFGKDAKALIDAAQEGKGGDLFKQARRAYENYSNEFTNRDVIDKAMRTKPGTKDRAVAYEDIFNHSILNGSTDDVRHVFRVLEAHPVGSDPAVVQAGQQAAKDLRGAVVNHIKDEMQKNLNVDSTGARTGSPAKIDAIVRELDKDGKLDVIFGKANAEKIRDLRDVAIDIYTSPTGTVNSSNTASALMRKLDDIAGYAKGTPIIGKAVNYSAQAIKSANTRRKVRDAINPNLKDLKGGN
jgi:hypothetical protein